MRILVCGGRGYGVPTLLPEINGQPLDTPEAAEARAEAERGRFLRSLQHICDTNDVDAIIEGCATGADSLAEAFARIYGIVLRHFPADWTTYGRDAGQRRNGQMLVEGRPDLVVAFPGGRGTANMIAQAEKAGIPVRRVE
jgi:hypothetical protein